jgi:hypothetical protein
MRRVVGWGSGVPTLLLVACLALVSCGEDEPVATESTSSASDPASAEPSGEPVPPGTPVCTDVWIGDAELPRTYKGCDEDGSYVKADGLGCSSGQRIIRYADRFYAVPGGTIHEADGSLDQDSEYQAAVRRCRA